jgi:micrococcal nuclease
MTEIGDKYWYDAKVVRVVDGDTIILHVDLGMKTYAKHSVRLLGVNTPEVYGVKKGSPEYLKGLEASEFVKALLAEGTEVRIRTHKDKTGKYGRYLAEVFIEGDSLNDMLIERGWGSDV